jgi:serine/threonine protein phosphatase 1
MQTNQHSNRPGRLLAVGDIHGCLRQLEEVLNKAAPTAVDQVVFLGDYVDRGPQSAGVIDYLIDFGKTYPATVFLRGNHEQMFVGYLDGHDPAAFLLNGGLKTLSSYQDSGQWPIPEAHRLFLDGLANFYQTDDYIFVHAGLRPGVPLAEQEISDLLWIRREFINSAYDWGKTVVFGHTPLEQPMLEEKRMGLDTGCVYGRLLTCCDVRTAEVWQA